MPEEPSSPGRLAPATLLAAGIASAATTIVIGRFGLAGTLLGAAVAPILVALVAEGVRRPAERVRVRAGSTVVRRPRRSLERVSWRRVGTIGLGAFAVVVAAFTLADLARGESPVSDRGTTFFTPGERGPADSPLEDPSPEPVEPREEEPEPTVTEPPATDTQPAPPTEPPPTTGPTETGTTPGG